MLKITFKPNFFTVIVNDKCTFQEYLVEFRLNYVKRTSILVGKSEVDSKQPATRLTTSTSR